MSDEPDFYDEESEKTFVIPLNLGDPMKQVYNRFMAHYTPFGFQHRDDEIEFHPLPYKPGPDDKLLIEKPWRIILELYDQAQRMVMGLDLHGDVILGRGDSRPGRIILDLDNYGAQQSGVSREHVMLRPTTNRLFAIDQGSTNGTTINGAPSGRGIATPLNNEDLLSLGNMVLMVHIVSKPK